MAEDVALFTRDGNSFMGNSCAGGPWGPRDLSGGSVLALLGHVLEDVPTVVPMSLSRMTVDLMRPVPSDQKLRIESVVRREGKKLQVVDLVVKSGDTEHALARALRLRDENISEALGQSQPASIGKPLPSIPPPSEYQRLIPPGAGTGFIPRGIDFVRRPEMVEGPNTIWMRLRVAVVEGEAIRPTSRATVPMDVVNLIGYALDIRKVTAINADVGAHITRYPVGEWVAITGNTHVDGALGHGVSVGTLSDSAGVFGTTSMAQIFDPIKNR